MSKDKDTKNNILFKSMDLFYEHGYSGTSIRDIVKDLNMSVSTVYIYFKDKNEILFNIIENIGLKLTDNLSYVIETNSDPVICIKKMIFEQICMIKRHRKNIVIYMDELHRLSNDHKYVIQKQHRYIYDMYYKKVDELVRLGIIKDINKSTIIFSIFGLINWTYRWFDENKELSVEEVANLKVQIIFEGLLLSK